MSYIGNTTVGASYAIDTFSGDGSTVNFTLRDAPASTSAILVFVGGLRQELNTYSLSSTTLTFTAAPPLGTLNIQVVFSGAGTSVAVPSDGSVTTVKMASNITLTGNTTTSNLIVTGNTTTGNLIVTGNVTGNLIVTGNTTTSNLIVTGNTTTSNLIVTGNTTTGNLIVTGNVTGNLIVTGNTTTGNLLVTGNTTTGNLTATGTIVSNVAGVGQFSSASTMGFKNRIINGHMQVAQRANSNTITAASTIANGYSTVDRFYVYCTGANVTAAQVAGSGAIKNRLQITGAASVTAVGIGQRIEQLNSYDMAGSTATLSADLAISATLTTVTWTASYANTADTFGTLASPTITQIATGTFTVSATVTNFNAQITIPAAATTGIQVVFTVGALTAGLTWTIGNVQLEKGSTATSFDYRPYGTELALCQRYFQQIVKGTTASTIGSSSYFSATRADGVTFLPVSMRALPAFSVVTGASYYRVYLAGTTYSCSTIIFSASNSDFSKILFYNNTDLTGMTNGAGWWETQNASSSIGLTAEL